MDPKKVIGISVRELCEAALKSGDLSSGGFETSKMLAGGVVHRLLQREGGAGYQSEVSVTYTHHTDFAALEIGGRMDGLITAADGGITVDEIKTISSGIGDIEEDDNPEFWGQAKCYAYIYCAGNSLDEISVRLTYYSHLTKEIKRFVKKTSRCELEFFFNALLDFYIKRLKTVSEWRVVRDASIKNLPFPFGGYRKGQRDMAVFVYKALKSKTSIFAEAPTGTGKTAAALFPAIKAMGESFGAKIFYLTAKNITRGIAEMSVNIMRAGGLKIKTVTITAKDKACPREPRDCDPLVCPMAAGYYDRLNAALDDIYQNDDFNFETISAYAHKYSICPFEFSLDLSLLADIIICDYNYLFDPRVYLRRYFEEGPGDYCFLIDEAHNLVERAREMYSAELSGPRINSVRREFRKTAAALYKKFAKIIKLFKNFGAAFDENKDFMSEAAPPEELIAAVSAVADAMREYFAGAEDKDSISEDALELFFDFLSFIRISELYSETHLSCYYKEKSSARVKLFCLNPGPHIARAVKLGRAAVFFSATLSPIDYFIKILGGGDKTPYIKLQPPFDEKNLCVLSELNVQTRYSRRAESYRAVAELIKEAATARRGNYLAFFPSYAYLNSVLEELNSSPPEGCRILVQQPAMTEAARGEFLSNFGEDAGQSGGIIGFAVMGGVFGEGIDLCGERLSGAIIVGVGLPQVSKERELISGYFEAKNLCGFDFAYVYPGINRVLQAAGRVIRTETDRGIVLLIDSRFGETKYKRLLPDNWKRGRAVNGSADARRALENFWRLK
jgi:DNA excision repair protein ERCC-2